MFVEEYTNKHGQLKYRFVERYTDPLTNKRKQVSVTMNRNGKQSQKEAMKRLNAKIQDKLRHQEHVTLEYLTFHKTCDEYLEHYIKTSGSKRSTIKNVESQIKSIKENFDSDILVTKMNASIIQKQLNNWNIEVSSEHLNRMRINIIMIFKYLKSYYGYEHITFIDDIKVPKKAKSLEEIQTQRNKYLEAHEVKELLQLFDKEIDTITHGKSKSLAIRVKDLVEFQILNGVRVGEALAITTDDIDFNNKKLVVSGTIAWQPDTSTGMYGIKDTTKTAYSYRTIDLSDRSIELLNKIILENKTAKAWHKEYNKDSNFIFTTSTGSPVYIHKINKLLKTVTDKSSFKHKRITSHALRHTHITTLAGLGLPLKAIMERVGHTSEKTTIQLYTHVTDQMTKDLINKLNEHEKKVI